MDNINNICCKHVIKTIKLLLYRLCGTHSYDSIARGIISSIGILCRILSCLPVRSLYDRDFSQINYRSNREAVT